MHNHRIPTNHSRKGPPNHANQLHLAPKKEAAEITDSQPRPTKSPLPKAFKE